VEYRNRTMIVRVAFLLQTLFLSLSLEAQCEPNSIEVIVSNDTEVKEEPSECNGPYKGMPVTREMIDQARSQGKTDFCMANLNYVDLSGANLMDTDLSGADLSCTILSGAFLAEANLSGATLMDTDLSGADLAFADLSKAQFEPLSGKLPLLDSIALANGLSELTYARPPALVNLRKQFKDVGYREQERQITYALKFRETANKLERGFKQSLLDHGQKVVDASFNYLLFGLTTKWGMQPGRALWVLLVLIVLFSPAYWWALRKPDADGIWRVWNEDRQRPDLGKNDAERPIQVQGMKAWRIALFFSVTSSFNIGWRELNVGNWISRLQRYEFTYRATGLIRTVSGAQSLLSVYLVAMWALTYFGRPFE
jgi:hypothetical protein